MEETPQENSDNILETTKEETSNKEVEIEKSESVETETKEEKTDDEKSNSECSEQRSDSDDASVILEREEGDGQESTPNRKVDDDEDKRNPQYIPKRGTFYEHDDRTAVDEENEEEDKNQKVEKDSGKKVWSEKEASKWNHDRYNVQEQAPKSRAELVAIYGYDIRNEEGPPRARRRRRYGRGPNKYTRNWEDEEAYSKPTNVSAKPSPRKPRQSKGEEFPPLVGEKGPRSNSKSSEVSDPGAGGDLGGESSSTSVKDEGGDAKQQPVPPAENGARNSYSAPKREQQQQRKSNYKDEVPHNAGNVRGVTKTRGFFKNGGRGIDSNRARNQKNQKSNQDNEYSDYILSQNFTNKSLNQQQQHQEQNVQKLEKDMANMSMQQHEFSSSGTTSRGGKFTNSSNPRQNSVPPRLQGEQRGSKRYSSLRQRSLPDTAATPPFGHQPYYPEQICPAQQTGGQGLLGHPQNSNSSQIMPTNGAPPLIQGPYAPPYPQPPAFLQPSVAPPPFIPQQAPPPQIINFAQPPQAYAQPPPNFTNFQHQQFNPVNQAQTAELYQPQGGITYYSPQNQQIMPRVPQKRIKAAIPIVPPPEHKEPRGRGRLNHGEDSPVGTALEGSGEEPLMLDPALGMQFQAEAPVIVQQ